MFAQRNDIRWCSDTGRGDDENVPGRNKLCLDKPLDVYGDYIPEEDGGALNTLPEPLAPTAEPAAIVVPLRRHFG